MWAEFLTLDEITAFVILILLVVGRGLPLLPRCGLIVVRWRPGATKVG